MNFFGDYHTHTRHAKRWWFPVKHAKGTLEENVRAAAEQGLKEIGITDHGFNQGLFGTRRKTVKRLKEEAKELSKKYNINILIGVEANLISLDGDIDVHPSDMEVLDFVICGFHRVARATGLKHTFRLFFKTLVFAIIGQAKRLIERNTQIYIDMLNKNKIDVLVHPNTRPLPFLVDIVRVAEVAKQRGTLIEINCKSMFLTKPEVDKMVETGVKFVVDTDSHRPERIGHFEAGEKVIRDYNIPEENISNLNKLPEFINYKRK
ncbi:MAG: PHP domain-containing protein [Christensenellaceae bacterium]|jgi:putative hydrolase|nr:PHP domain-containing protein [Christensenellaceae bacterium]